MSENRRPTVDCCACHGRACYDEPCCPDCTEHHHWPNGGITSGTHTDGTPCASPDPWSGGWANTSAPITGAEAIRATRAARRSAQQRRETADYIRTSSRTRR